MVIEELDGKPYIIRVRERASRVNMEKYWEERDGWRLKDGLEPKWAGTNVSMAFGLLWRNGGLEDHATMLRLSADKRWAYSRHNLVVCKACTGQQPHLWVSYGNADIPKDRQTSWGAERGRESAPGSIQHGA